MAMIQIKAYVRNIIDRSIRGEKVKIEEVKIAFFWLDWTILLLIGYEVQE